MTLPNFLIIGAAKSGTTALYRYIKQHPDIFMTDRKEPHFFSFTDETKQTEGPGDYVRTAITDFHLYQQLFEKASSQNAIGEASPTYIYIPGTAERIHKKIPDVKLIAILRHPAERAFSAYMHLVRDGFETELNFEKALSKEPERIANNWGPIWHYTKAGYYAEQLQRYYSLFDRRQIHVLIYDDFKLNPILVIHEIFRFLEVEDSFIPDMNAKPNVSGIPKNKVWQSVLGYFFDRDNVVRNISRRLIAEDVRWRFTSTLRNKNLRQPSIPLRTRTNLIDLFRSDIVRLQELIKRDLSHWLN